jgi:phage-related protein
VDLGKLFNDVFTVCIEGYQKLYTILFEFYQNLYEAFKEKILPALKDLFSKFETIFYSAYEETVSLVTAVIERVAKALKSFEVDFNKISETVSDLLKNTASALSKYTETLEKEIRDIYKLIVDIIQNLPGLETFKEQYEEVFIS